jgi:2'-5' RNA ligase
MARTTRTFVAIAIPAPLGEKLTRLQARLSSEIRDVRWSSTLPFHATLSFLGDVADAELNKVCTAVDDAIVPFEPFEVSVEGVGAFPNPSRPRVIWAGLKVPDGSPLFVLQRAIVRVLTRIGHRPEDQRFTPHTTLGRIKSDRRGIRPRDLTKVLEPCHAWSAGQFTVTDVTTFASALTPEGPDYVPLARARLSGKKEPHPLDPDQLKR